MGLRTSLPEVRPDIAHPWPLERTYLSDSQIAYNALLGLSLMGWLAALAVGQIDWTSKLWGMISIVGLTWVCLLSNRFRLRTSAIWFVLLHSVGQSNLIVDRGLPRVLMYADDVLVIMLFLVVAAHRVRDLIRLPIVKFVVWSVAAMSLLGFVGGTCNLIPPWITIPAMLRSVILGPVLMLIVMTLSLAEGEEARLLEIFTVVCLASLACNLGQIMHNHSLWPTPALGDLYWGFLGRGFSNDASVLMGIMASIWVAKIVFGPKQARGRAVLFLMGVLYSMFLGQGQVALQSWPLIVLVSLYVVSTMQQTTGKAVTRFAYARRGLLVPVLAIAVTLLIVTWDVAGRWVWIQVSERATRTITYLSSSSTDSINRLTYLHYTWDYGFDSVVTRLLGNGPGSYGSAIAGSGLYVSPVAQKLDNIMRVRYVAPSRIVSLLAEYGVVGAFLGLLLPIGLVFYAFARCRDGLRKDKGWLLVALAVAGLSILPSFITAGALETQGVGNTFWLLAGLALRTQFQDGGG